MTRGRGERGLREKRETESLKQLDGGTVVFFARNEQLRLSRFLCTGNERCKWFFEG